jgi:hypothetical protein
LAFRLGEGSDPGYFWSSTFSFLEEYCDQALGIVHKAR